MPAIPGTVVHVVDDDSSFRTSVARLLRAAGYDTETYDSADAFLAADVSLGGCLLLDVRMPEVDGLELYRLLRRSAPSLPVVFISGHSDAILHDEVMRAGAVECLSKPVEASSLFDAIDRAIQSHLACRRPA